MKGWKSGLFVNYGLLHIFISSLQNVPLGSGSVIYWPLGSRIRNWALRIQGSAYERNIYGSHNTGYLLFSMVVLRHTLSLLLKSITAHGIVNLKMLLISFVQAWEAVVPERWPLPAAGVPVVDPPVRSHQPQVDLAPWEPLSHKHKFILYTLREKRLLANSCGRGGSARNTMSFCCFVFSHVLGLRVLRDL